MNVFIVESSLQLLNAIEAKHHFRIKDDDCKLIIINGNSKLGNQQMKSLVTNEKWKNIRVVGGTRRIISWFLKTIQLKRIVKNLNDINKLFIGEIRSEFIQDFIVNVKYKEIYLLDDGNVTLNIDQSLKGLFSRKSKKFKGNIKKFIKGLLTIRKGVIDPDEINYFTVYDLKNNRSKIIKNEYSYLRSISEKKESKNEVYFLGSPLSEKNIIKQETYVGFLREVKKYFNQYKLVYIPHRSETKKKLSYINEVLNISIQRNKYCIEYELIQSKKIPLIVASFYSSALINCGYIFGEHIEIKAFYIDTILVNENNNLISRQEIESIYSYYEKLINVIDLNLKERHIG